MLLPWITLQPLFKYEIFVCAVLHIEDSKTTKSATWPDYCLLPGFLLRFFFLRPHCDIRYQILAILSVHHFKLIALINHHLMLSRSQQHTFGNNVTSIWLTQPFNPKLKAWLDPIPVNLFKVQSFICNLVISKLDGFSAPLKWETKDKISGTSNTIDQIRDQSVFSSFLAKLFIAITNMGHRLALTERYRNMWNIRI